MAIYSFIALFLGLNGLNHDFHVAVCEMDHDLEDKSVKITHRIFVDDFEEALRMWSYGFDVDLLNPTELDKQEKLIEVYMQKAFEVEIDGKDVTEEYIGTEIDNNVIQVYIKISDVKKIKSLKIKNQLLMELFLDQINIIHFQTGEFKQSLKFDLRNQVNELEVG